MQLMPDDCLFSAQSKWVTERLCQVASQLTPIRAGVLRESCAFTIREMVIEVRTGIGQMVGDSQNGVWNET